MATTRQHRQPALGSNARATVAHHHRRPWRRTFWKGHDILWNRDDPQRDEGRGVFEGRFFTAAAVRWWHPLDRRAARRNLRKLEGYEYERRFDTYGPGLGEA